MKFLVKSLATLAIIATASVSAQYDTDATIPFAQEPEHIDADGDIHFVDQPGYSDANATRSLDFSEVDEGRELQVIEGVIVAFQIAAAVAPLVAQVIEGSKKKCQQIACWVATDSRTCGLSVAEKVQADMTMGRDRYRIENIKPNGMWVRYWRTKFEPIDRADVATGTCTNGVKFAVTNCQSSGSVHC